MYMGKSDIYIQCLDETELNW